jgi:O-antigen/teichoic acid export membrane protein
MAVGTVVLARLLTPEDYGLVAMVAAVTSFVAGFKDLGLAASTVQRAEINHQQTSTLFWVNVAFGFVLSVVVSAAAPALAAFYREPRVLWLTVFMASTFLISSIGTQHHSLLRRQLRFGEVAGIEFGAALIAVIVAIVAALNGAAYWSLALMYGVAQLGTTAGVWLRCKWVPGYPSGAAGVRDMLAIGGYLTGFNIVNSFLRAFDRMLIGYTASAAPLGLYSRASFLVSIPMERLTAAASAVAIPVFSRLQGDPERYRAFVHTAIMLFGAVAIPFGCFAFAAADSTVLALLGAKWIGAAPIVRALSPLAIFATLETSALWVSSSTGHTQRPFAVGIALALASVGAMIVGLRWGVIGVAIGFSSAYAVVWSAALGFCLQPSPVRVGDVARALWRSGVAAAAGVMATLVAGRLDAVGQSAIVLLARDAIAFFAAYGACWLLLPGGRAKLRELQSLAQAFRPHQSP